MKIFKKVLKVFWWIFVGIIFFLLIIFIYHNISNRVESKYLKAVGKYVEVYEGERMHTVSLGGGDYTMVMLSGMGTPSPYYDYYSLANELSKNNRVIILEQLGYGYSDGTSKERTLKNYYNEIKTVLDYYNVKDNVILMAHSYMGVISLGFSKEYSNIIDGLVCLDCTTSYQIEGNEHLKNEKQSSIYKYLSKIGLTRVSLLLSSKQVEEYYLKDVPREYHEAYKHFIYNNVASEVVINEANNMYDNQKELLYEKYGESLYVSTILSSETIKEMKVYYKNGDFKYDWETMHDKLISNYDIQKVYILEGSHYIHHGNISKITGIVNNMINDIESN